MKINLIQKGSRTNTKNSFQLIFLVLALVSLIIVYGFTTFQHEAMDATNPVAQGSGVSLLDLIQAPDEESNNQGRFSALDQISVSTTWMKESLFILLFLFIFWKLVINLRRKLERQTKNRQLAEHAFQEKNQQYKRLLTQLSHYFIYKRDNSGKFTYVSESIEKILGYNASQFKSNFRQYLTNLPSNQSCIQHFKKLENISLEYRNEVEILDHAGELHWLELTEIGIKDSKGKIISWEGIGRDITEIRNTQEKLEHAKSLAEHANQTKSDFLANMSHEIRTPMNAIMGMSYLALRTDLTDQQRDYITKIKNASDGLLGIINDILDFSKIEAGKLTMERINFNLNDVIENLVNICTTKLDQKGLEFIINKSDSIPNLLIGDPLRLGQVLTNLVSNAIKFTQQGEIIISIECLNKTEQQVELCFSIKDTGIGINEEQINKLFQSFSQADTSTTRKYGGTGLGLAISKHLVELMQGEIQVQSTPGQGSTFIFNALFNINQKETLHKPKSFDRMLKDMKILIVDDNQTARDLITAMLSNHTVNTHAVSSGKSAIFEVEKADNEGAPYDLVLMDWKMPQMDGLETIKKIRSDNQLDHIPALVMVSAFDREELIQQSGEIKLDGIITKPINFSVLIDGMLNAIGSLDPQPKTPEQKFLPNTEPNKFLSKKTILLVEDNSINQQVAREMLYELNLSVIIAENGLEALEALKKNRFDLILMDLQMPEMDGFQATREIRKLSQFDNLPIIAMTAHAMSTDKEKCLSAGMNDHLAKPIEPDNLSQVLADWLKDDIETTQQDAIQIEDKKEEKQLLPDFLPGIEQTEGLKKLRFNYALYHKLLNEFYEDHKETAINMQVFLQEHDSLAAKQSIHTIKGVAGNLGVTELYKSATLLERVLIKESDYKEPLSQFIKTFDNVMNGLADLFSVNNTQPQTSDTKDIDYQNIKQHIELLKQDLENHDFQSSERLVCLHDALGNNHAELYKKLEKNIDGFLFRNALNCLDELNCKINSLNKYSKTEPLIYDEDNV